MALTSNDRTWEPSGEFILLWILLYFVSSPSSTFIFWSHKIYTSSIKPVLCFYFPYRTQVSTICIIQAHSQDWTWDGAFIMASKSKKFRHKVGRGASDLPDALCVRAWDIVIWFFFFVFIVYMIFLFIIHISSGRKKRGTTTSSFIYIMCPFNKVISCPPKNNSRKLILMKVLDFELGATSPCHLLVSKIY